MQNNDQQTSAIAFSDMFFTSYWALPPAVRSEVSDLLRRIRILLSDDELLYEQIPAGDGVSSYLSVKVKSTYRAVISQPEGSRVYLLLWVGKEEEALTWAKTHICSLNPVTGSLQVYEVLPSEPKEKPKKEKTAAPKQPALFAPYSDEDLLSLGVPQTVLSAVRTLTNRDELEAIRKNLPLEAFESLVWLADGESLSSVREAYGKLEQTADAKKALENPRSRRTFRVVEDDEAMQRIVDMSLERWRVFLHPLQQSIVDRKATGPTLVRGSAGTGKTVVAMHRAAKLVKADDWKTGEKLLFTTYTKNLAIDIEAQLKSLCKPDEMRRIEVTNLDAWVASFLKRSGVTRRITYPGKRDYQECWKAALCEADSLIELPESFYDEEWKRVVLAQEITSEADYLKAPRKGRGTPLTRSQRKAIWPVFDEMRSALADRSLMTIEDACFTAARLIGQQASRTHYRAVVVDETQDFGNEALRLLAILATPDCLEGENAEPNLFMVGDGQQRIYDRTGSLSSCGINVRGRRSTRLRLTYRTTDEIRKAANAVLEGIAFADMDDGAENRAGDLANRHGSAPMTFVAKNLAAECQWIHERISEIKASLNLSESDICVVARTNDLVGQYEKSLSALGHETKTLSRKEHDDPAQSGLRFATMHRVKGLEYRVIFIAGASEGVIPQKVKSADPEERKISEKTERSLFYVAASRAKDALFVSCHGNEGAFLKLLAS